MGHMNDIARALVDQHDEAKRLRSELATLREAVEVLGRECQLATHAIANFKTKHGPKTYADWAMHVQKRNANPTARAAVEKP